MTNPAKNPFRFGDPVEGEYYFPRAELTKTVLQFLDNKIHVVLIGPRRMGKTSFILDTINREEKAGKTCLLIDVFNVTSHRDFLQQFFRALSANKNWSQKLKDWIDSVPQLRPKLSWERNAVTGEPTYSLQFEADSLEENIKELFLEEVYHMAKSCLL